MTTWPRARRVGITVIDSVLPRVLARVLGPTLRARRPGDRSFLDRFSRTHGDAILELPAAHWDRLVEAHGLVGFGSLLDVGCGTGAWLPALARRNGAVVATDIDEDSLETAKGLAAGLDNVEISRMPAEHLAFRDARFDAVACYSVLPYVDQTRAIQEIARVLKAGGKLFLGTPGPGYYARHILEGARHEDLAAIRYGLDPLIVASARALLGDRVARASVKSWSPRAVRRLLRRNGFSIDSLVADVDAADPQWETTVLGRPVYFVVSATKRG